MQLLLLFLLQISKLKKQKPVQSQLPKEEKKSEPQTFMQRPPTGKLKLDINKPKGNIYDAVRKVDEDTQGGSVHKPTLSFKKNKLLKGEKQTSNLNSDNNRGQGQDLQGSTQNPTIPRPTPLFNRNKAKLIGSKSKQKPVISNQSPQHLNPPTNNVNRMAYVHEEQPQDQPSMPQAEQPSKKLIKPNLFKGVGDKKPTKLLNNSPTEKHQQRMLNNSEVYQEYETENKKEKFSFQKMMHVEKAEINLERKVEEVSIDKVEKQAKRVRDLGKLLNLQIDLYQPLVSISSTTPFEVYISKIKSGFLKNSCDQAFDMQSSTSSQTQSFQYVSFSNQCPQDYQQSHSLTQSEPSNIDELVLKTSPVIEQLLKPSKNIVMPPTSLLAFSPTFRKFLKCPSPTLVYFSEQWGYSLVAIGEKLYINEDEIECALDLGGSKVAGLKNGKIVLWNGENDKGSKTYALIRELIQSQNFQLPVHVTNDIDKLSPYLCQGSIVALVQGNQKNSFYSFDSTAKLVKWSIQKASKKTVLVPKQLTELSKILEKKYIVGLGMKRRNQTFYLWTSSGIICWDASGVTQKLQASGIRDFYLPKRSNLVFCLTEFKTLLIFSTEYHLVLQQITLANIQQEIQQMIVPELQHENRQISIFYQLYLIGQRGSIYELLLTNSTVESRTISQSGQQGGKSKRTSNVIYQGINALGSKVQKIKLFKDLKCVTQVSELGIDLSANVNNLKSIIMKNKQFVSSLMENNCLMV